MNSSDQKRTLLIETNMFKVDSKILKESIVNPNVPFRVRGILQRAGFKNQNGRIYPKEVLVREAQRYNDTFIKEKRALGELDHAQSEIVNLKNVSHNIVEMHWEGDELIGTVEVLTTPSGNILRELFRNNVNVGISSRALGSLNKVNEDTSIVGDDLNSYIYLHDFITDQESIEASRGNALLRLDWELGLVEIPDKVKEKLRTLRDVVGKSDWMNREQYEASKSHFMAAITEITELVAEDEQLSASLIYYDKRYQEVPTLPHEKIDRVGKVE